jgi:hypothetical protein
MQCEQYIIDIQRYLDNDLDEQEQKQLLEHIEGCPDCKQEFEAYVALHKELLVLPKVEIDNSCIDDILNKVDLLELNNEANNEVNKPSFFKRYNKYIVSGIAAAAVLLAVYIGDDYINNDTPYAGEQMRAMDDAGMQSEVAPDTQSEFNMLKIQEPLDNLTQRSFIAPDNGESMQQFGVDRELLAELAIIDENINKLPSEISEWVKHSREIFAGQSYVYNGKTYIYVSLGEKYNKQHKVTIDNIYQDNGSLYVYINVQEPQEDIKTEQIVIYPSQLVSVQGEYYQVSFNEWQGAEIDTWIPEIYGVESIPDFTEGSSDIIKIYSPEPDNTLANSIVIKGIARTFDGSVYYRIVTDTQEEIASGFIYASRGAPDWGHFEQEIFIDLPPSINQVKADIEVYEVSLRDGGKLGTVTIPITIKAAHEGSNGDYQAKQWVSYLVKEVDVKKQQIYVEQLSVDANTSHVPSLLELKGVPIIRDITNEKANTISQNADITDIDVNSEIGAIVTNTGEIKQIFLFD